MNENTNGAKCVTCGEKDTTGIKTTIIKKYMMLQTHYRNLIRSYGKMNIPVSEQYYCKGRNAVLQELMEELGLRKDIKKPLFNNKKAVN